MTAYLYPMDHTGCGSYRITWPAKILQEKGYDIRIITPGEDGGLKATVDKGSARAKSIIIPPDCDMVVLQRPTNLTLVSCIPYMIEAGLKVIVEIDDDLAAISPRHPGWAVLHQRGTLQNQAWSAVVEACRLATRVVCSTPAILERYGGGGRGFLVRNRLPGHFFDAQLKKVDPDRQEIGWAGGILSHPDDLSVVGAALAQLRAPVKIVGPKPVKFVYDDKGRPVLDDGIPRKVDDMERSRRLLGVDADYTGPIKFEEWIPAVSQIHTGMAPLEDSRFNEAKSWLKPLEYSVARVPFVHSMTPEYLALGAGIPAGRPKDWRIQLRKLLTDPFLREDEIERNWEIACANRIDMHIGDWEEAWFG